MGCADIIVGATTRAAINIISSASLGGRPSRGSSTIKRTIKLRVGTVVSEANMISTQLKKCEKLNKNQEQNLRTRIKEQ